MKEIQNTRINRVKNSIYTHKINYTEYKKNDVTLRFK